MSRVADVNALRKMAKEAALNVDFDTLLEGFVATCELGEHFTEDGKLEIRPDLLRAAFKELVESIAAVIPSAVTIYNPLDGLLLGSVVLAAMGSQGWMKRIFGRHEVCFVEVLKEASQASKQSVVADRWNARRHKTPAWEKAHQVVTEHVQAARGTTEAPFNIFCRILYGSHNKKEGFFDEVAVVRRHLLCVQRGMIDIRVKHGLDLDSMKRDIQHVYGLVVEVSGEVGDLKRPRFQAAPFISSLGPPSASTAASSSDAPSRRDSLSSTSSSLHEDSHMTLLSRLLGEK